MTETTRMWSLAELLGAKKKRKKRIPKGQSVSQELQATLNTEMGELEKTLKGIVTNEVLTDFFKVKKTPYVSGWETVVEGNIYRTTGIAPYYSITPSTLFVDKYYETIKKKFDVFETPESEPTTQDPMVVDIKDIAKTTHFSVSFSCTYNGWVKSNKFIITFRLNAKELEFVTIALNKGNREPIIQNIFSDFWVTRTIDPIYDMSYKVEKIDKSGTIKLFDGSLFFIPEDPSNFDRRAEFLKIYQDKGIAPKTFPILLDIKREALIQTDTTGAIATFSLSGSMPVVDEDLKKLLENTLNDGVTSGTGSSIFRIWDARRHLDTTQLDFITQNSDVPMNTLQDKGQLLPFLREVKAVYESRKDGVLRSNYLRVMGYVQALIQNAKKYRTIAKNVEDKRRAFNSATGKDVPPVPNMGTHFVFLPHQAEIIAKLNKAKETAILDVSMGGGKTPTVLIDAAMLIQKGEVKRPLVAMPKKLIGQWIGEIDFFSGGQMNAIAITTETVKSWGEEKMAKMCKSAPPNTIFLTSYSYLTLDKRINPFSKKTKSFIFPKVEWIKELIAPDFVCLDESHFIKKPTAIRSQACMALRDAPYRRIATGTLITNNPPDLIGQIAFLDPSALGDRKAFNERYAAEYSEKTGKVYRWKSEDVEGIDAADMIREDLRNNTFYLMYREKDWAALLPEIDYGYHFVDMTTNQKKIYAALVTEMMEEILSDPILGGKWGEFAAGEEDLESLNSPRLLGKMAKLEQFITAPDHFQSKSYEDKAGFVYTLDSPIDKISPKLKMIDELIGKSIAAGNKCIVGVHYKFCAKHLAENSIYSSSSVYYDAGETAAIERFETDKDTKVLFAVIQCFEGDTYVMVDYDKAVMIKDIYKNDKITHILSYDLEKKEIVKKKIKTKSRQDATKDTFYNLSIKKPGTDKGKYTVRVTPNHQIWSHTRKEYVKVRDLRVGEKIVVYNGDFEYYSPCKECGKFFKSNRQGWISHSGKHKVGLSYEERYGEKKAREIKEKISLFVKENMPEHYLKETTFDEYFGKGVSLKMRKRMSEFASQTWEEKFGKETADRMKKEASKKIKGVSDVVRLGKKVAKRKARILSEEMSKRQKGRTWEEQMGKERATERKIKHREALGRATAKAGKSPNIPEQNVINLGISGLYFVGDGSYNIGLGLFSRRSSKRCKECDRDICRVKSKGSWVRNPDFVIFDDAVCGDCIHHTKRKKCFEKVDTAKACSRFKPKRGVRTGKIVEINGSHFHCSREEHILTRLYKKRGIRVLNIPAERCYKPKDLEKVRGKIESFANNHVSEVVDIRKSGIKRDYKYTFDIQETHNYFVVARKDRSNDPKDGVPFLVSNSITEGMNLQMADRIVLADVDWTPGKYKQLVGRVYRPYIDKKTGKNLNDNKNVFVDVVLANSSADALKYCYQTRKKLFNSQVMEKSPIKPPPPLALSEENLHASMSAFGKDYIDSDKDYNNWMLSEVNEQRAKGDAILIPVKHTPPIEGSKSVDIPWVSGMKAPLDVEGTSMTLWAKEKKIDLLRLGRASDASKEERKEIKKNFFDLVVKTQWGEGRVVGVSARTVNVKYPDGTTKRVKFNMAVVLEKTVLEGEKKKEKRKKKEAKKKERDYRTKIGLVLYNNIPTLLASLKDTDNEDLKDLGFVYQGPYWLLKVRNQKFGDEVLKRLQKKFTIKGIREIKEIIAQMKGSKIEIKTFEIPDTKIFFRRKHILAKKGILKMYSVVKGDKVFLVIDKETNKGSFATYKFKNK